MLPFSVKNLRRNWFFPLSALAFFCLQITLFKFSHVSSILFAVFAAVAVAVITAIQKPTTTTEPDETETEKLTQTEAKTTEVLPVVTEAKLGLQVDFQKMIEEKISDDMEVIRCSEMDYNGDGKKEASA